MANGTLYIVPLSRFEYRTEGKRHRGREWLCTDLQEGQRCMLVSGQAVTGIPVYAEGVHAVDFFSGKRLGTVLRTERGTVLEIGSIRAPLAAADPENAVNYAATAAEVKAFLEPLRPVQKEIAAALQQRFDTVNAETAPAAPALTEEALREVQARPARSSAPAPEEPEQAAGPEDAEAPESSETPEAPERPEKTRGTGKKGKKSKAGKKGKKSKKKKNKKRRTIILLILAILILVLICVRAVKNFNASCGADVQWTYNAEYHYLGLQGEGDSWDYPMSFLKLDTPWNRADYGSEIQNLDIEEGITSIGDELFSNTAITSVYIPDSVTTIGDEAFKDCRQLTKVTLSENVTSIGNDAFCTNAGDDNILTIYYGGTSDQWVQLMKGTCIDSKGYYIRVSCSDLWIIQNAANGIYGQTGDDEWTRLDDEQHQVLTSEGLQNLGEATKGTDVTGSADGE